MPRRNRNAAATLPRPDLLADKMHQLARDIGVVPVTPCAACGTNPATSGEYCLLCRGLITLSARRSILTRR